MWYLYFDSIGITGLTPCLFQDCKSRKLKKNTMGVEITIRPKAPTKRKSHPHPSPHEALM